MVNYLQNKLYQLNIITAIFFNYPRKIRNNYTIILHKTHLDNTIAIKYSLAKSLPNYKTLQRNHNTNEIIETSVFDSRSQVYAMLLCLQYVISGIIILLLLRSMPKNTFCYTHEHTDTY